MAPGQSTSVMMFNNVHICFILQRVEGRYETMNVRAILSVSYSQTHPPVFNQAHSSSSFFGKAKKTLSAYACAKEKHTHIIERESE